eukprot:jgi/Mesvir1/26830/Mv20588-RA.1
MAGKVIRSVMRETSPETTMFTANDYRFIREKLATVSVGECGNKRVRPFQLPNIIRKRKKQEPPTVTRALFSTPGLGHLEKSWKSSVPVSENSPPDDSEPPPLSDSLVGTPELGEYSRMTSVEGLRRLAQRDGLQGPDPAVRALGVPRCGRVPGHGPAGGVLLLLRLPPVRSQPPLVEAHGAGRVTY